MRTMLFSQSKDIPYALSGSFMGILGGTFGLVFSDRPGQGGGFAFQPAGELLASTRCRPNSVLVGYLEVPLGLAARSGDRLF